MALAVKKRSSYSWDRSGVRKIQFKALKANEKIGFSLGGDGKRPEIATVKEGTQSYWKGVEKGYCIVAVNGTKVDSITVKTAVRDACRSGKNFTIAMSTGLPSDIRKSTSDLRKSTSDLRKSSSKPKAERSSSRAKKRSAPKAAKKKRAAAPVDDQKEEVKEQGYNDEKPIIDKGEFTYQDDMDVGGWFDGEDPGSDYTPIARR